MHDKHSLYLSLIEGTDRYKIGRTKLHEFIRLNAFRTIKVGSRTLIDRQSADDFFAGLPSAAPLSGQ